MLKLRRILVANDRRACAARAYAHALRLAERFGAEIHLVEADVPHDRVYDEPEVDLPRPPSDLHVEWATMRGDAVAAVLLDYAEANDIDLIVMGTHGQRGLGHFFLGSTAERVVRETRCPVLTVRVDSGAALAEDHPSRIHRILVPIDFSDRSEETLRYAFELADVWDAEVDVLHALNVPTTPDIYGLGEETWSITVPDLVERSREALKRAVRNATGDAHLGEVIVEVDTPAAAILDAAERLGTDLIVIATHGLTGLERFALGSVTERVVRRAACPVFTVKSFGRSLLPPLAEFVARGVRSGREGSPRASVAAP